jgi:hypothetical protein
MISEVRLRQIIRCVIAMNGLVVKTQSHTLQGENA